MKSETELCTKLSYYYHRLLCHSLVRQNVRQHSATRFSHFNRSKLLAVIACFSLLSICINATAQNGLYIVRNTVSSCLNVRQEPDASSRIITCLTAGTQVTVINTIPFWRQVKLENNETGWVSKKYIEPIGEAVPDTGEVVIPDNAFLTVNFVDVGQGDAIWIQTYNDGIAGNGIFEGYSIIIDGGPVSTDANNRLYSFIKNKGFDGTEIKALFVTHPHDDHYPGALTIARHFIVDDYYDPNYPGTSSYQSFISELKAPGSKVKHMHMGKDSFGIFSWGREIKAQVLYAWPGNDNDGSLGSGGTEVNNASIVLRIQYGQDIFLFMGDAEGKERDDDPATPKYVEKILLATVRDKLKATVPKIAHHGSETSSTIPFIHAVNPDIVVVESGRKSFSGTYLPDVSTLQRYCSFNPNVKIYRTDQGDEAAGLTGSNCADGDDVIIKSNGKGKPVVSAFDHGTLITTTFCGN